MSARRTTFALNQQVAALFFPLGDQAKQLLATAGIFALGFFMHPLGGWIFGYIVDTRGRRFSMIISVFLMCGCSLMIAVLPTYETIGMAAGSAPSRSHSQS